MAVFTERYVFHGSSTIAMNEDDQQKVTSVHSIVMHFDGTKGAYYFPIQMAHQLMRHDAQLLILQAGHLRL